MPEVRKTALNWLRVCAAMVPLSGCMVVPDENLDFAGLATRWRATLPHDGKTADLLDWWKTFNDKALSDLLAAAEANSPTLEVSVASIDKARATIASSRAGLFPTLTGDGSVTRSGTNGRAAAQVKPSTASSGSLDASWEIDLFGKARSTLDAARKRESEAVANWYDARVTLAAEVAEDYVKYRACRQLENVYAQEYESESRTLKATEIAVETGLKARSDLDLVRAGAATAASSLKSQIGACDILIKSLSELTAQDEGTVRATLKGGSTGIPRPAKLAVDAVPADVVRQRPDINALEREVAASISDIGAAKADLYPSFTFSGTLTANYSTLAGHTAPWSFGPAISIPIFDGGTLRAAVKSKEAAYREAVANYKSGVLSAINDIESAMVNIKTTQGQLGDVVTAAKSYHDYFAAIDKNWQAGGASVLDREEARRDAESADITVIETRRDAVVYWISLYKALGGGWRLSADGEPDLSTSRSQGARP